MSDIYSTLPLHEPLLIFTVLIGIILLSPFIFRLIKIPDVASYIIAGILIGPFGFNILSRDSSIELLGTIGLLYIMFIAGLELDPEKLKESGKNSVVFGIFTFIFPFILGFLVSRFILQLEYNATLLVSIMFSTHTLVAYPIARKIGIGRDITVITAVGGTIITDTLVLILLSIITKTTGDTPAGLHILKVLLLFGSYLFVIFYSYPKIAGWFFKHIKRDRPVHFLFLLLLVCVSSVLAELIGLEAIIGSFVAGLALSRKIPKHSLLMQHVDFVGSILFIPIFLIGIGMLINTKILVSGSYLWLVSFILILSAISGKWIAAFFSQKVLKLSSDQRNLLFGLTSSHAAATIAVILIGYEKQMVDITLFNSAILIILVSSLAASFITERFGKRIAITSIPVSKAKIQQRILVPVSNPATMANSFQTSQSAEPIYILSIVNDDNYTRENLVRIRETLEKDISEFNNLSENLKVITRVDLNISSGILRAAKEYLTSDIILGWSDKITASQRIFGSILDHLKKGTQTLYVCHFETPLNEIDTANIIIPAGIEFDPIFPDILDRIMKLPLKRNYKINYLLLDRSDKSGIKDLLRGLFIRNSRINLYNIDERTFGHSERHSLSVLISPRKESVGFKASVNSKLQKMLFTEDHINFIIIIPGIANIS
ncbi:MAG: cation:proton antiporter [Bacteroidales bacterium]|nr:cation:proton antiporter [Bacteroidales bacterium]